MFPVIIDPPHNRLMDAKKDTFASRQHPAYSPGGATELRIGSQTDDNAINRSFLKFDLSQLARPERRVFDAEMFLFNHNSGRAKRADEVIRRISDQWTEPGTNWNNQPPAAEHWDTYSGCGANHGCHGWHRWQLWGLFERWIHEGVPNHVRNDGLRISGPGPHPRSWKVYYSSEQPPFGKTDVRPQVFITFNDPPKRPHLLEPATSTVIETESPTLRIVKPEGGLNDPNGDDVFVKYELSFTPDFSSIELDSGWLDKGYHWVVPAGELKDGQTYYWRALTSDLLKMPNRHPDPVEVPSAEVRTLIVSLPKYGDDERWAMWRQPLGNGVGVGVNEANGNLFLDYPLDSLVTPGGPLDLRLTYNSQQDANSGLGPGWTLSMGPAARVGPLPAKLWTPQWGGAAIRFGDGGVRHFPHLQGNQYGSIGGGSGTLSETDDPAAKWRYRTASGAMFVFNASGELVEALPVAGAGPARASSTRTPEAISPRCPIRLGGR